MLREILIIGKNYLHFQQKGTKLAKNAAVIVVVIWRKNFEFNEKPAITHQFDAGAAWENLALEATSRELVTLGMQGFDFNEARKVLGIPDSFDVMAMIAIGKLGQKENLLRDLQERDTPLIETFRRNSIGG